jgi:hypothetical protein
MIVEGTEYSVEANFATPWSMALHANVAAQLDAGPARLTWQLCHATTKGAAATFAAPCSMAL